VTSKPASSTPIQLRYLAIVLGVLFLLWIPIEDMHEGFVLLLAGSMCAWLAARHLSRTHNARGRLWLRQTAIGLTAGIAVTPVSLMLMIFKNGIHAHEVPDFSAQQMASVIEMTPIWASSGLLVGLGSSLWKKARDR
jgi:hypothetical protein